MQHANNHDRIHERSVVDRIGVVKRDTQSGSELLARRCREWKVSHRLERPFDRRDKARCDFLGRLARDINPDFGEVFLRGISNLKY